MRANRRRLIQRLGLGALSLVISSVALSGVIMSATGSKDVLGRRWAAVPYPAHQVRPPDLDDPAIMSSSSTPLPKQQPKNPPAPQYKPPPPAPAYQGPVATTPAAAVAAAVAVGRSRGVRVGVAVLDRKTGKFYGDGDVDGQFASASVMKVFIATRLLVDGRSGDATVQAQMWQMIVASDDDAARTLYQLVGTESLIPWVANRYHIGGLAPANVPNYWGLTRITARAMVNFYNAVARDPVVAPWLLKAMANAHATAADGFHQYFGIPSAAANWRVKQGWMCCLENLTRMHSTGYITGDRYAVAMLIEGSRGVYGNYGAQTLTLMARALLPGGTIPQAPTPSPSPTTPSPTPPSPSPSPTEPPPTPTEPPPTSTEPPPSPDPTPTESTTPPGRGGVLIAAGARPG